MLRVHRRAVARKASDTSKIASIALRQLSVATLAAATAVAEGTAARINSRSAVPEAVADCGSLRAAAQQARLALEDSVPGAARVLVEFASESMGWLGHVTCPQCTFPCSIERQ